MNSQLDPLNIYNQAVRPMGYMGAPSMNPQGMTNPGMPPGMANPQGMASPAGMVNPGMANPGMGAPGMNPNGLIGNQMNGRYDFGEPKAPLDMLGQRDQRERPSTPPKERGSIGLPNTLYPGVMGDNTKIVPLASESPINIPAHHGKSLRSIQLFENPNSLAFPHVGHQMANPTVRASLYEPMPVRQPIKLNIHADSCYNFLNKRRWNFASEDELTPLEAFFWRESIGQYKVAKMLNRTSSR